MLLVLNFAHMFSNPKFPQVQDDGFDHRPVAYLTFVLAPGSGHCACSRIRMWFGAPISRRRIYIALIMQDVLSDCALRNDFHELMEKKLESMNLPVKIQWFLVMKTLHKQF